MQGVHYNEVVEHSGGEIVIKMDMEHRDNAGMECWELTDTTHFSDSLINLNCYEKPNCANCEVSIPLSHFPS